MSLKAKVEAIIYATEEPVTLNELAALLKDATLAELRAAEEARLALNEALSDGTVAAAEDDDADDAPFDAEPAAEITSGSPPAEVTSESASADASTAPVTEVAPGASIKDQKQAQAKEDIKVAKAHLSTIVDELIADYASGDRGMEIRQIAGGYRMATKPEHHDVVVSFAKSLKPPVRLSLQALETLAVIAYKQPVTVPEISEIRGVDSAGVIATLFDRKLITTGGRKQVIGRPILYKTTKEFLMRFGLKDLAELPSMEEFEKLGDPQAELFEAKAPAAEAHPEDASSTQEANSDTEAEPTVPAENKDASDSELNVATVDSGASDADEPVTEAVPEPGSHLMGDTTLSADGTYATEAEPGESQEKS
jgi:segregation and condensation protein B